MRKENGSALITVIMVVLVLTMVGLAITYFMQVEDRTSGNDLRMKQALYAAETGLRAGERVLVGVPGASYSSIANAATDGVVTLAVNPTIPVIPVSSSEFDINHLGTYLRSDGTATGPIMANLDVPTTTLRARYSLFVRIAKGSVGATRIQLVSAGWVEDATGPIAVKILAEEYGSDAAGATNTLPQKGGGAGGTNAVQISK